LLVRRGEGSEKRGLGWRFQKQARLLREGRKNNKGFRSRGKEKASEPKRKGKKRKTFPSTKQIKRALKKGGNNHCEKGEKRK